MIAYFIGGPQDMTKLEIPCGHEFLFPMMGIPKRTPVLHGPHADTFTLDPFKWTDDDCNPTFPVHVYRASGHTQYGTVYVYDGIRE